VEIIFVGRKYALDSEKTISLEYKEIEKLKMKFISLQAGRLTRILSLKSIVNFLRIPFGIIKAFLIVNEERPDKVISFGSYLALPIVIWSSIFKIPVYTHEQTINPGLSNKIIGRFSKKIFVAFDDAVQHFNFKKTIVCGNPVRSSIFKVIKRPFIIKKDRPVIYITGGSLGSHSINEHIKKIIMQLLKDYIVIHQVGDTKEYQDFERLKGLKDLMSEKFKNRYYLRKHFFEDEIGYIYSISDLVVGRAGANTFFELVYLTLPALFIPLPWSSGREQQKHAEIFAKKGIGEIFHQIEPSAKLLRLINLMVENKIRYKENFKKLGALYKKNAAKIMVDQILG
ncbi:MAG: hypothetical protein UR89_C0010G0001, partial [Candidatus Roizmanbacteria bacterium GW2011_GWA2_35_8]